MNLTSFHLEHIKYTLQAAVTVCMLFVRAAPLTVAFKQDRTDNRRSHVKQRTIMHSTGFTEVLRLFATVRHNQMRFTGAMGKTVEGKETLRLLHKTLLCKAKIK